MSLGQEMTENSPQANMLSRSRAYQHLHRLVSLRLLFHIVCTRTSTLSLLLVCVCVCVFIYHTRPKPSVHNDLHSRVKKGSPMLQLNVELWALRLWQGPRSVVTSTHRARRLGKHARCRSRLTSPWGILRSALAPRTTTGDWSKHQDQGCAQQQAAGRSVRLHLFSCAGRGASLASDRVVRIYFPPRAARGRPPLFNSAAGLHGSGERRRGRSLTVPCMPWSNLAPKVRREIKRRYVRVSCPWDCPAHHDYLTLTKDGVVPILDVGV